MLSTAQGSVPSGVFTYTASFPGIPIQSMVGAVGILMSACGVTHSIPVDNSVSNSITTGNPDIDAANGYRYFDLKTKLIELTREFTRVDCQTSIAGHGIRLVLSCY